MIADPTLFVECDYCHHQVGFSFSLVVSRQDWQADPRFDGWFIDWKGTQGDTRCPDCLHKE